MNAFCSGEVEFAGLLVLRKRTICSCSSRLPMEPLLGQPVVSRVPLEMGSGRLEQPAEIQQADNALKDVLCLLFSSVFLITQHLSRSVSEERVFLSSSKTQQAGDW